jgi:hypothetical protein
VGKDVVGNSLEARSKVGDKLHVKDIVRKEE